MPFFHIVSNLVSYLYIMMLSYTDLKKREVINIADGAYYFGIENQGEKCHIGKIVGEWNIDRLYTIPENVTILSEKKNTNILANTVYGFKINVEDTQTGVLITVLLNIPINIIIKALTDVSGISKLPLGGAIVLVLISTILTMIAGLIPAKVASKKDPVEALRTE